MGRKGKLPLKADTPRSLADLVIMASVLVDRFPRRFSSSQGRQTLASTRPIPLYGRRR
jgi:hypothetical protein